MRGKAHGGGRARAPSRIIPAHAGKRAPAYALHRSRWDHPRSCGEKGQGELELPRRQGSSPLMRGKVPVFKLDTALRRIIPAHAGKSPARCGLCRSHRDHPRSCGEKTRTGTASSAVVGSSPLMRGKECRSAASIDPNGIIPAHAGKRICDGIALCRKGDHPRSCGT